MRITVEKLQFFLEVFLRENPKWADCEVVVEYENGGRVLARRPKYAGLDMEWEFKEIYVYTADR